LGEVSEECSSNSHANRIEKVLSRQNNKCVTRVNSFIILSEITAHIALDVSPNKECPNNLFKFLK